MVGVEDLAQRAVDSVNLLARKGIALATWVAVITLAICGLSYLTGLAAMTGSIRDAWLVIGTTMFVIGVGAPLLARWRLVRIRKDATELVREFRTLMSSDASAERVVIEAMEAGEGRAGGSAPAVVGQTAQFNRLRTVAFQTNDLRSLAFALRSLTTFPLYLGVGVIMSIVFAILGFLFLVAWVV